MIKIGCRCLGTHDIKYSRTVWEVSGTLEVKGNTIFGGGSKISIGENGRLVTGSNFGVSGETKIICNKEILFGHDCLLSWEILIMDTDFHDVINDVNEKINADSSIILGDHIWVGCRSTILKGVRIGSHNIIAAGSVITKSILSQNNIIGGNGRNAEIIKSGIDWKM